MAASRVVLFVMFSIGVWCGKFAIIFSRLPMVVPNQLSVFTKLNNKYLGVVVNPFSQKSFTFASSYDALRNLQDQIALLFKHEYLPSRYLVLYVGEVRLTKPNFPFVNQLDSVDSEDQAQVCHVLKDAQSIYVVYHLDQSCAKASLEARGLFCDTLDANHPRHAEHGLHVVERVRLLSQSVLPQSVLVLPELDAWAFGGCVQRLVLCFTAHSLGTLENFLHLTCLEMSYLSSVKIVNFKSLAATCKMLDTLYLRLQASPSSALSGVGHLCNLKYLSIQGLARKDAHFVKTSLVVIPDEVGKLVKLTYLCISGWEFGGLIPKELGRLLQLERLSFQSTHLSGSIPTELGLLSNLTSLDLSYNPDLCGSIPLRMLATVRIELRGTPNVNYP